MGATKRVQKKKSALRSLKGALKSLLKDEKILENEASTLIPKKRGRPRGSTKDKDKTTMKDTDKIVDSRNGIRYIMSKEKMIIPKLTDEEVMERHKKADETMKNVWLNLIQKYENVKDQGDIINLQTGEIIEDHGHIRNINSNEYTTTYNTNLGDIMYKNSDVSEMIDLNNNDDNGYILSEDDDEKDKSVWET